MEEDSYDVDLIEDLFNSKKKFKIVKPESNVKTGNYISRMTTEG